MTMKLPGKHSCPCRILNFETVGLDGRRRIGAAGTNWYYRVKMDEGADWPQLDVSFKASDLVLVAKAQR